MYARIRTTRGCYSNRLARDLKPGSLQRSLNGSPFGLQVESLQLRPLVREVESDDPR